MTTTPDPVDPLVEARRRIGELQDALDSTRVANAKLARDNFALTNTVTQLRTEKDKLARELAEARRDGG
jgi:hypothetical protein